MKTLIVYSTKYGSVEKCSKILKEKMGGDIDLVNVMKENVPALEQYDMVILGGSIYVGKIQKKLTDYMERNLSTLIKKRIGLFICAGNPESIAIEIENAFPKELRNVSVWEDCFGYEFDFKKLNFFDKFILKTIKATTESKFELSEEKIGSFAKRILSK